MKKEANVTPFYLDKEGYNDLLVSIERLKLKLNQVNSGRKAAFDTGARSGWDSPEFSEIERMEAIIVGQLESAYEKLDRVVIVEKNENSNFVDIGDIVKLQIMLTIDKYDEKLFKLVGGIPNFESGAEVREISVNSPIGKAIYRKRIGEKCIYSVNNKYFEVIIKEKVNYTEEPEEPEETSKLRLTKRI